MPNNFAFTPLPPSRAESRRPAMASALAGNWRGELVDDAGTRQAFTLLRDASVDAFVAGRILFFVTHNVPPTGVKLLEAAGSTFVALIGPYFDPRENADVITILEGIRRDTVIEGSFYTRADSWHALVRRGHFVAQRSEARGANKAA